jgi:hypothetical protein
VPLGRLQTLKFTQSVNQLNKQSVIQASVCIALRSFMFDLVSLLLEFQEKILISLQFNVKSHCVIPEVANQAWQLIRRCQIMYYINTGFCIVLSPRFRVWDRNINGLLRRLPDPFQFILPLTPCCRPCLQSLLHFNSLLHSGPIWGGGEVCICVSYTWGQDY